MQQHACTQSGYWLIGLKRESHIETSYHHALAELKPFPPKVYISCLFLNGLLGQIDNCNIDAEKSMGFSSQLDIIRSLFLRLHVLSKRKKRLSVRHAVGCVGRLRSLSIPTLSSLRSWREEPPEQRRRKKRKQKRDPEESYAVEEVIVCTDGLPSEEEEFSKFTAIHPGYLETLVVDELRDEEYGELQEDGHVCLDYSGHGLFSQLQQELDSSSSSFAITHIPGDLSPQALHDRPHEGTVESDIRRRIMRFLNIQEGEYGMVFTASKGSAFKILGESYPFDAQRSLLTMFDYESEAVRSIQETAQSHGAKALTASFNFPSLSVWSAHLKSQILSKHEEENYKNMGDDIDLMESCGDKTKKRRKKRFDTTNEEKCSALESKKEQKGLFVFPVQSRVSGTRYSYQWMSLAQDNGWHVLLDASALGPKDMDSLGLSLFRPDFIITSFYKVFGSDPTGFGCLFVKNSSMSILYQSEAARSIGMVRLIALPGSSSPSNHCSNECHDPLSEKVSAKHKLFSSMQGSKEEPIEAEVAFSGPASTFSRWKTSMKGAISMKMGVCVEEVNEEKESVSLKVSTGVMNCTFDVYTDHVEGATQSLTAELEKSKTPITPRSVLEESLLEVLDHSHDGESHELSKCSSSGFATQEQEIQCGESLQVSSGNVLAKREYMTYYSHEIAGQGNSSTYKGAFSQPLISRDMRENPFLTQSEGSSYYDELDFSSSLYDDDGDEDEDEGSSEFDFRDDPFHVRRREPEIYCRGLNHADSLGLNKTNDRLRFLTNWLIASMMKLQHLVSNKFVPLVHLYGPKAKYDRGASLAFNLFDRGGALVQPSLVQELAYRDNISLGLGVLSHIRFPEGCPDLQSTSVTALLPSAPASKLESATELQVVTAALGFFTNFEDVYRLWAFMAKFLDAEFALLDVIH